MRLGALADWVRPRPSVYFYTLHKCASTLFANYVLKNVIGLRHVNYERRIYQNGTVPDDIAFARRGVVYGPLRLTSFGVPALEQFRASVATSTFIDGKTAIFLVRDPRDILVSAYYSFGMSHGFSPAGGIRAVQEQQRSDILRFSVDEYALANAARIATAFATLDELQQQCRQSIVLRYEDMISHWDAFVTGLTRFMRFERPVLAEIYRQSRPKETEDVTSHRRSGRPGGFRGKLQEATIASLNATLHPVIEKFRYTG